MKYRPAILTASVLLVVAVASSFASRKALGVVVDSCKANFALTGSTFPCLKMVRASQPLASYAILREPTHKERTILTPLADVSGVEDPLLLTADGPNYFDLAWKERLLVLDAYPEKDSWLDAAVAINAADNRSQDHLHIHIGCVSARIKSALASNLTEISTHQFQHVRTRLDWRSFWARFYPAEDLSRLNPFHIVADNIPGARDDMGDMTISVVGAKVDGRRGFYILAQLYGADDSYGSAEDLLDARCLR